MPRIAAALATCAALAALAGFAAPPAWADNTYVDDAVAALGSERAFVSPGLAERIDPAVVLAGDPDGLVAVAVLPEAARIESTPGDAAEQISKATDWRTVLVAIGGDLSAKSADLAAGQAAEIANGAETGDGSLEARLAEAVSGLAGELASGGGGGGDAGSGDGRGGGLSTPWLIVIGVLVAPILLLGALATWLVVRYRRRRGGAPARISRATPQDVSHHLERLRDLRGRYLSVRADPSGQAAAKAMATAIGRIVANTSELFRRLERKGSADQKAVAQVEYRDQLGKVWDVLGEDYFGDIIARPDLWDDPAARIRAVTTAVEAFAEQIVANIRQVNAAQDLRFQVSLDALARARRDPAAGLYDAPERPQP
jgi:uncharacterized membrane protein